jgi:molybdopterin molybdotransferase
MQDSCASPDLLSFEQALITMLDSINPILDCEVVPLSMALDRVLAEPVVSPIAVPSCDNSAMDGFAFAVNSINDNDCLKLAGRSMAGRPYNEKCQFGECIRIMTGACLPRGCDTVVMQENCEVKDNHVKILAQVEKGTNIRRAGEDIGQGNLVFSESRKLSAADIGVLASLGLAHVSVYRQIRVAILSTGDELKKPSEPLASGDIYESNSYFISRILQRLNVDVIELGIIEDDQKLIEQAFVNADKLADAVISTGGVSVGEADYTKQVLAQLGDIGFWKIAMKPGKPFAFGRLANSYFFGLPGNPVSALVTAHQLVVPALLKLQHAELKKALTIKVKCSVFLKKAIGRKDFQRGILSVNDAGELAVCSTGSQGSGILTSISSANCYIILAAEQGNVGVGEIVTVQPFDSYLQ